MTPTPLLLVDHHPVVLEGLRGFLARQAPAWEVCAAASDGFEALARATELQPRVAIVEYELRLLDGLEVARQLKERLPALEIVIFSGVTSPYCLHRIFHSRVRGFVLKSDPAEEILFALESVRRGYRFRSRAVTELCDQLEQRRAVLQSLTRRETEVLRLVAAGRSSKEIASDLGLSPKTIETHRTCLLRKLKLCCVAELVRFAIASGIVEV